jgi:putative transposase
LYLAFILDVYSRKVVGWSMASHLRTELVVDALEMALWRRRPDAGLIYHTDQGAQYTALSFGKRLEEAGIVPSMGRAGSALDNAISESFVASLKTELLHRHRFLSREAARTAIFDYIESFYNRQRRHSSLGYLSPSEYEQATMAEVAVAYAKIVRHLGVIPVSRFCGLGQPLADKTLKDRIPRGVAATCRSRVV